LQEYALGGRHCNFLQNPRFLRGDPTFKEILDAAPRHRRAPSPDHGRVESGFADSHRVRGIGVNKLPGERKGIGPSRRLKLEYISSQSTVQAKNSNASGKVTYLPEEYC
jgi:hypothetical protein